MNTDTPLPVRWSAPECVSHLVFDGPSPTPEEVEERYKDIKHTQASDVWAFAHTVWQVFTGLLPYHTFSNMLTLAAAIHSGEARLGWELGRNNKCQNCPPHWRALMRRCCARDPLDRPSFEELLLELGGGSEVADEGSEYVVGGPP